MSIGCLHFSDVESAAVEVHAEDAMIWLASSQSTQGAIMILAPKLLQIIAERGNFELQLSRRVPNPPGRTDPSNLSRSSERPDRTAVAGAQKGAVGKAAYSIVGSVLQL